MWVWSTIDHNSKYISWIPESTKKIHHWSQTFSTMKIIQWQQWKYTHELPSLSSFIVTTGDCHTTCLNSSSAAGSISIICVFFSSFKQFFNFQWSQLFELLFWHHIMQYWKWIASKVVGVYGLLPTQSHGRYM